MNKKTKIFILTSTLIAISISSVVVKQEPIRTLPLLISLFIALFQSNANRYAYLAGGLNSILYAWVYYSLGLYASAASVFCFSFPLQILTFINWQKHSYQQATTFKKMSNRTRIIVTLSCLGTWLVVFIVLICAGSQYAILDNTTSLLGVIYLILSMLTYIEYSHIWLASSLLQIVLNLQVFFNDTSYLPYLISSIYNMYCTILCFITVRNLYRKQQASDTEC